MNRDGGARSRRSFVFVASLVLAAVAAAVALGLRLTGNERAVLPGGTSYSEAVVGTWQRINPLYVNANEVDRDLSALVFSGLMRIGPDGQAVPDLAAEAPEVSDGGTVYTFRLRSNARWHDGEAVTSRDVAFTVGILKDPGFGDPALAEGWLGVEVETPDDRTVVLRLRQPSAPFLARTATVGILPEHLLGGKSADALENDPFNARPVGSGPYRLESLDSQAATLTANPAYHLGRPGIDRMVLRFYPDAERARQALAEGAVDGLFLRPESAGGSVAGLTGLEGKTLSTPMTSQSAILYLNNSNALFRDERVRRAISLALDREGLAREVYQGTATPSGSPVPPETWAYAGEFDTRTPDLTEAKRLLEEAGWTPHPTTGILVQEGREFRFTIRVDTAPERVALASAAAKQLEQLGMRAAVASTTFSVLRRDFLQERKYEAAIVAWDQGPDPDLYFGWHSSQLGAAGLNLANFEDAVMDDLIARGRTSPDIEVRKDAYRQVQEVWQGVQPSVVLLYVSAVWARPAGLRDITDGVLFAGAGRFYDVQRWRR
ncbi:peptide ABC transporter substrate-binding protein [Tepidiforma sp.]|uniref:peptide ABC transporter substrate-binding protein n=1 Tax=Tepidiforma sp. TaxID=2682230 RepID=UPI002ADD329A|nr:peptide ABC transporter substrate-binding protein [Tepidiforma sp.]